MDPRKNEAPWEVIQTFEQEGLVVEVQRLRLGRPKYSIRVGSRRPSGDLSWHISVRRVEGDDKVALVLPYALILTKLVTDAENYVHAQMVWDWDRWLEQKQSFEARSIANQSKTRHTGKTERKKARRRQGATQDA